MRKPCFFSKTIIRNICCICGLFFVFCISDSILADEILDQFNITISLKQMNEEKTSQNLEGFTLIVGNNALLNVNVKNMSNLSLAYDKRLIQWPQNYSLLQHSTQSTITSLIRLNLQRLPYTQNDIVILDPGDEYSHDVYLHNIFPWGLPEQGHWKNNFGQIGEIGRYTLFFENSIPLGTNDWLNKAGFNGNFFEGVMYGQMEFSIVPPPSLNKKQILMQLETILDSPPETPTDKNLVQVFLESYYVAPDDFQEILLKKHKFTLSPNKLMACYFGLNMLNTHEAKAAIEPYISQHNQTQYQNSDDINPSTNHDVNPYNNDINTINSKNIIGSAVKQTIMHRLLIIVSFITFIGFLVVYILYRTRAMPKNRK